MSAQPKHIGRHTTGQMRRAHALRLQARGILEDKFSLLQDIVQRVDDLIRDGATSDEAWADFAVAAGLETIGTIERIYAKVIAEAEHYDGLMQDIGA